VPVKPLLAPLVVAPPVRARPAHAVPLPAVRQRANRLHPRQSRAVLTLERQLRPARELLAVELADFLIPSSSVQPGAVGIAPDPAYSRCVSASSEVHSPSQG